MFMNELTPGDKMSLKGKIFELQKKLSILDVEQQNTEDFSFHPEITHYKLPNRKDDFINNLNQAEETRKDRFETLKKQLLIERSEDCSFAPQINRRKKDLQALKSQKPVFLRLTEKGKEYQDSAEKRKEMCKSHDFDGKRLFQPTSAQKPRVEKGNMQVEEYLFRDAKDRVEKMDIKRENEKKSLERIASKQKMNKHSALLVKRKCEREAREIFDNIQSCLPQTADEDAPASELNVTISSDHLTKTTLDMLKFFEHNRGSLSFHNSVSHATSPYEVADKAWAMLDPDETNDVSLKMFLTIAIPVLVAGGSTDVGTVANKGKVSDSTCAVLEPAKVSFLYQFLSACHFYFNKKKKQEKENESLNAKKFVKKSSKKSSKTGGNAMSASFSQDTSVNDTDDTHSRAQSEVSDGISVSESLKSYREKAAMSRKIQSYNKVLTDREILAQNRLELLRESLIQKEMEECTFQPRISNTAHQLKAKEVASQSTQLDDASNSTAPVKVYDRLYAEKDTVPRSIAQEKHEHSSNRGLDECTFTPKLIHSHFVPFNHNSSASSESVIKSDEGRVYSGRRQSRMEKNISNFFGDLELESGNQRIFKPSESMDSSRNELSDKVNKTEAKKASPAPTSAPRGYSDSIRRIREAASKKKKKEAEDEAFFAVNEERYNNGLQIMAEGPKPFRLRTEERHSEKEKMYAEVMHAQGQDGPTRTGDSSEALPSDALDSIRGKTKKLNGELKPIRLYVEIKLGAVKKSHIAVADFDVPLLLAKDFCKIYGLDPGAEQELSKVVESNMLANDIPIGSILDGNHGLAYDGMGKANRRSFADSATFSSNNFDEDDEEYTFYDGSVPQEQSVPLYDHPF